MRAYGREYGRRYQHPDPEAQRARKRKWAEDNRVEVQRRARERYLAEQVRLRAAVRVHYGPDCRCCGESGDWFLTVDHVAGDGAAHRRTIPSAAAKGLTGVRFYAWLEKQGWPSGFQMLCWNCNTGRHLNGGICPHLAVTLTPEQASRQDDV